jgi:hypothetical protein
MQGGLSFQFKGGYATAAFNPSRTSFPSFKVERLVARKVDLFESTRPYRKGDKLLEYGKVLFRLDEWDRKYFPHVVG